MLESGISYHTPTVVCGPSVVYALLQGVWQEAEVLWTGH